MFPARRDVVKAKEGTLEDTPFPLLLHALSVEEKTCTLELKLRNLEKRIVFDAGTPVSCESNLLHETLGKYLVSRGKLTEEQHHSLLADSFATGKQLGGLLVEKQLVSAFELFKHMQTNLAQRVLDVFRWTDAKWKLLPEQDVADAHSNEHHAARLHGSRQLADETVARHFPVSQQQRLALNPDGPKPQDELKLSAKETRLLNLMKARPTLAELLAAPGFTREEITRRLFALAVLEMIDLAERIDARPAKAPAVAPVAEAAKPAAPPSGLGFLDSDEKAMNFLAAEFLTFRGKDSFDLLGVSVDVEAAALQKTFLAKTEAISPVRFKSADSKAKAEVLLVAYARAFGALADHESRLLQRKRRDVAEAAKKAGPAKPDAAAEHFRIRTDLLDADSQFSEGLKRFEAGNLKGAVEHFEYACDIEPRGRFLAYLAFARFRANPTTGGPKALAELSDACAREPTCEEAWAFRGDVALGFSRLEEAEDAYRKAYKLAPKNKRYADQIKAVLGLKAKAAK